MPEIVDVTVRNRRLRSVVPDGFETAVRGAKIKEYRRKGKYIVIDLDNGRSIIWHLGMSGRVKTVKSNAAPEEKHDHVIIKTSAGLLIFNDPRRFGLIYACPTAEVDRQPCFAAMGTDPFDPLLTPELLFERLQKRKTAIKPTLLDQKLIAGIGNIYASEILFAAGHPGPPAGPTGSAAGSAAACWKASGAVLTKAIDNGGSTLHDYHKPDGQSRLFSESALRLRQNRTALPGLQLLSRKRRRNPQNRTGRTFNLFLPGETKMKTMTKTDTRRFKKLLPALLCFWLAAADAGGAEFIDGLEDLPAMPGMSQLPNDNISFGNDESRFVEAYLSGRKTDFSAVAAFYEETLPQLGWHLTGRESGSLRFERDGERLDIVREKKRPLLIRITLKSKN